MKIAKHDIDIGLWWAKYINIWGQAGAVVGTFNFIMLLAVFYTTSIGPSKYSIPLWLYISIVVVGTVIGVVFVMKVGISGYYRFFSQKSEMSQINKRVKLIMDRLEIDDINMEGNIESGK